nr:reductive dehalogenase [Dehalococcoides mccartyi]
MTQFHNTLSRRDFMKGLGLAGAGVGAAAAVSPVFRDLDEMASAPSARVNMPWWVKQVNETTTPIDWDKLPILGSAYKGPPPMGLIPPAYPESEIHRMKMDRILEKYPNWEKGASTLGLAGTSADPEYPDYVGDIKDNALVMGSALLNMGMFPTELIMATGGKYMGLTDHPEGWRLMPPPEQRGGAKWQGTPEEALKIVRAAVRFYGFDDVTAIPVDDHFLKVMYGEKQLLTYGAPTTFEFGDVDDIVCTPAIRPTKIVIPRRMKWFLQFSSRQPGEVTRHALGTAQNAGQSYYYTSWVKIVKSIQDFLWGLGYISLDNINGRFAPTGATGILAGAGELARWGGVMTPKYGITVRVMHGVLTDLPLEECKPIDFGGRKFCETCGICADACPMGAISKDEPTWDAAKPYQYGGYLTWRTDMAVCSHCPVCQGTCPFNAFDKSGIHELVKGTVSTTSIFNSFFTTMDKSFDYGRKPPAEWWDSEQPVTGIDTSI